MPKTTWFPNSLLSWGLKLRRRKLKWFFMISLNESFLTSRSYAYFPQYPSRKTFNRNSENFLTLSRERYIHNSSMCGNGAVSIEHKKEPHRRTTEHRQKRWPKLSCAIDPFLARFFTRWVVTESLDAVLFWCCAVFYCALLSLCCFYPVSFFRALFWRALL